MSELGISLTAHKLTHTDDSRHTSPGLVVDELDRFDRIYPPFIVCVWDVDFFAVTHPVAVISFAMAYRVK